jgi:hypothetical protein
MPLDLAAFLVSVVSLVVALVALLRDNHRVVARAVFYETKSGMWAVSLVAANAGRRPITMSFVSAQPPGKPPHTRPFGTTGPVRVETSDSAVTCIEPGDPLFLWSSFEELRSFAFSCQDAVGKSYTAPAK